MVMFTIAVFAACMATLVASETSSKSYLRTTATTYDWERCVGGPKTGPKQLYGRLCDGDYHGKCIGTRIRSARVPHYTECADVCTDEGEKCQGFEFDHHDEYPCVLFYNVTGIEPVTENPWDKDHQCFKKEPPKVPKCKEEVILGHYKRLCDYDKHGTCQGIDLGLPLSFETLQDCADACTANSTCAGFEYDSYDTTNDCYLYSEVVRAEHPDWDDFFHECVKKLPTTSTGPTTSTVVTEAATSAAPEGDADELPEAETSATPEGDTDKAASVSQTASSAPATKIVSTLAIILTVASTFM